MIRVLRPSFEVVKEGRIFLTEKMSWKYSSPYKSIIFKIVMRDKNAAFP
jgi:hypothetical protein